MELCEGSVRDIFEYSDDPLLEQEIALIMHESLKVNFYRNQKIQQKSLSSSYQQYLQLKGVRIHAQFKLNS